jgi:LAS superfamily LD-carboxypeptidase LdcB
LKVGNEYWFWLKFRRGGQNVEWHFVESWKWSLVQKSDHNFESRKST